MIDRSWIDEERTGTSRLGELKKMKGTEEVQRKEKNRSRWNRFSQSVVNVMPELLRRIGESYFALTVSSSSS